MSEPEESPEADNSSGPYTCSRCRCGTWNDDDMCDDCANEWRDEMEE